MVENGYESRAADQIGPQKFPQKDNSALQNEKPTYALEHLATFKVKHESEIRNPKEKIKMLIELDKTGGVWPQKMFMCFSGKWLLMLDSDMKEIENFPGSMITEPTAFISDDPLETFNNILIFTVPGVSLGNTEMHIFQVTDVSSVHMVEDLKQLRSGKTVTIDRNKSPIRLPKPDKSTKVGRDQFGIALAAAEVAAEKNAQDREQTTRDILIINHCFEDIERFIARLQYAAEALCELELRQNEHNPHGEGLLILRSRPPIESEFTDIFAKLKLAMIFVVKLQNHFNNVTEPINNIFTSLHTLVKVCNDVYVGLNVPENVAKPLLKRETVNFLNSCLNAHDIDFWHGLGSFWTTPKDQFKDPQGSFHPIFYDDWSPDWVVDEEVSYLPPVIRKSLPSPMDNNNTWLARLQTRNVKIAEVIFNKTANNDKELNVVKGEFLEVIDDSRNWWKARNSAGYIGYIPHTVLNPYNFEQNLNYLGKDTDSLTSSLVDQENHTSMYYNAPNAYVPIERASLSQQAAAMKTTVPRSFSMPNVPIPPPMPPTSESLPTTPSGTLKRNMAAAGTLAAMRARNDCETNDEALMLQSSINDELKYTLMQRERRKDLEILKTPQIYINQNSTAREVEEWLRGKGFSDTIIKKLLTLNGDEIFALSPHEIEGYFGQQESRRLISQIVLQKNISGYKTLRSSELNAKLAKARQKVDLRGNEPDEIF